MRFDRTMQTTTLNPAELQVIQKSFNDYVQAMHLHMCEHDRFLNDMTYSLYRIQVLATGIVGMMQRANIVPNA